MPVSTEATILVEHDYINSIEDSAVALVAWVREPKTEIWVTVMDRETERVSSVLVKVDGDSVTVGEVKPHVDPYDHQVLLLEDPALAGFEKPLEGHGVCVVCLVGNAETEHDPADHQAVGVHEADGVPTSEWCPGVAECADCQDVLRQPRPDAVQVWIVDEQGATFAFTDEVVARAYAATEKDRGAVNLVLFPATAPGQVVARGIAAVADWAASNAEPDERAEYLTGNAPDIAEQDAADDATWEPINDFPGDQQINVLPAGRDYWAQIGPDADGAWSSTILQVREHGGSNVPVDERRTHPSEEAAKAFVLAWRPEPLPAAEALDRIEANRPTLDADTTDADLAEWVRVTILPTLEATGHLRGTAIVRSDTGEVVAELGPRYVMQDYPPSEVPGRVVASMLTRDDASADEIADAAIHAYRGDPLRQHLVEQAAGLLEPGEVHHNPEYLRGMVELIIDATRWPEGSDSDTVRPAVLAAIEAEVRRQNPRHHWRR